MLTRDQAAAIFDRIKKLASADEVEVLISGGRFALTRFGFWRTDGARFHE